ncbi:tanabin [Xenopus laevis]|uniref:Tanabin n=1 Tax=Xenopus laevis TaxID=8355 RepID=TANA_XENLA|nr:tanabin [Xenopus laevis]Q01550.1 RecName: Full=Tanabin [Xenopus laevis]AAA49966.1 tanabin [Xenopus laevis]
MEGYLASVSLGEESTQMWSLNKRLEAYLSRVKALEEENELLRKEIHSLRSSKSERCWKKKHHEEMMKLRDALDDGHREMVQAEMVRDSIYEEIEFVKQRCLEEKQAREDAKKELSESKKLLEEETRAQIWLKERLGQLEAELEDILRDHEEEKALMEEEIASFSQRLENFRVAPVAFKPVEVDDYARKLSEIWQGAVEEYKSEVSVLEAGLSESKENLRKVLEENKQNRLLLQSLDKELVSLKMRKEALEDLLSKQWQEQKEEEEKLQRKAEALEQEKQDLRGQIAEVLEDRQQLMHLKMSLSLEVATYRSLLEAESTRIYTDYRGSYTFNDSMLEHNNVRRRQSEDTRKTVSKDHRQSYSKKQIGDKNELQRPSLNNFSTVKSSAVPVRTSPVTKEFQKVSSVLQSQGLKYTKAPQVKEVQTVSTVKSNLETHTFSGDAFRRAQVETRKTDEQVIKKDALGLNDLNKNTGFKEEKDIQKPGFMDHVVSKSVSSTEHKVPEIDPLESALKSLEEDLSSVSSTFNAGQSSNLEAIKDVLGEPICLENLQNEIAFEKESPGTNAAADPIEEVISESVSYQTVHFEKQELSNLLEIENTHENHVQDATQAFNSCEQDGHDRASTLENNEPDVQQYIRTLESNEIKESKIPSDNTEEAEIISKSRKVFLENEYIPVSKDDLTEFTSHLENDSESSQSFDSKLFENKSTEDQLITNLKSNTQENIFQSNQEHLENLEFDSVVPDTVKFMYPQENNLLEEENVYGDGELVQMATDENIINQSSDQLLLSDHSHHEETKTSESIAVEHNRMESEHAEVDKSSEIPVEISENVSVEEIIHEISDVEEDTKQAFEDERVGEQINQNNQESTVDLDGSVYSQEENSQLEEDEVSISEQIEKDFEINEQECLKSDQIREAFDTEEVDHQVVDFMQEQSFEREVGQLNNIKQEVDYLQNYDEDSFQNNDEPQELESCDLQEQKIKLEEENQLSENEGNQNFGGNDIEEFSQQGYDTDEICQETIGNQVSAQLLCESDINQDKLSMEDEEEQNNPETEDNIGLEQESDQENTRSNEGTKFSQEECDVVFKPEDMSDKSEYSGQQEDLDKQVTDFSLNEQANNDLLEKEEVILHHADDQRSVNDEITIDEKLSERIIDNELATVDVNESLAANKEQVDLFTDEYAVDDNVGMQDDDSGQYQTKEDLFVDGNNIIEKIEIQQTSLLNQEICERVDNVDEDISGEAKNESVEMNDVVDLVPEAKVTGDEQISPLQDEKLNLETMEDTKDNDGQLCLEKENETEYIEVTDSPQFATDLSHDAGRELTVDQNSANLQFCENPTKTLIAHHIEYETVADSDLESTEEQVQETERIPFKPEDSKMENENSESEESVDSQEISLNSHKSEEFEISKDYQLEQTLPDVTPLPNLEDEFEDLTEQPDVHEEHQNNDDSGASTFITSVDEDKEREVRESVSKDEESNEEEFGDVLSVDKTSQVEVTTLSGLAQEPSYLGDNEESEDSMENAEILNENPSNDIVDFMVSQMTETKIIIAEQVTEQTEVTLQFDDAPNKLTENLNAREKETYDYESNEENIEFTNENQSASPANDIVDENQSEDSVISDNEGTTSSYEDLPNATSISHVVALEESNISTTEQSSTDTKRMTYEGYEITSLQNVEDNAQETEKEFPSGVPLGQEDSRSEDEELDDEGSEFSFGVNDEKANGEHKDVGEDDETEDMLNGHSQTGYSKIVLTSKKALRWKRMF